MLSAQCILSDEQGLFIERFGLLIFALSMIEPCQIIKSRGDLGVFRSPYFLIDIECLPIERFGLLIFLLITIE